MDFKHLYFADLDIADVLTSIGMSVTIGGTEVNWAHDFGDLGGEPDGLDCTPLSATVKMQKAGLVDQGTWTVDYYFNDTDFAAMNALKAAGTTTSVVVAFSDGTKFSNTGKVTANYLGATGVNTVGDAHVVVELSNADGWEYSAASAG